MPAVGDMNVIDKNPALCRKHMRWAPIRLLIGVVFRILCLAARIVCSLVHRHHTPLPPIEDPVIAEPMVVLAEKIRHRELSSYTLMKAFIKRVRSTDPFLNYMVDHRFGEALMDAQKADDLVLSGKMTTEQLQNEKPLLGVPFTTKDGIGVRGLHQTGGLLARKKFICDDEAECVDRLKEAGAIPLGLTNVPELLMWWEAYNTVHGRTDNPYDNARTVGGSSGGEGCCQAVVGSSFGIGSDIGGSIRIPAHMNGVFGHKPTALTVSLEGHFPAVANELDTFCCGIGPITRKACDLKPILKVLTKDISEKLMENLNKHVRLSDVKLYFQRDCNKSTVVSFVEPSINDALSLAISHLKTVCKGPPMEVTFEKFAHTMDIWATTIYADSKETFTQEVLGTNSNLKLFLELGKSAAGRSRHTFISLLNCFLLERRCAKAGNPKHNDMLRMREELTEEVTQMLGDDGVLLFPTHPTSAPYHDETVILWSNICYTAVVNFMGLPATHVPMGLDEHGLPMGIQVIAGLHNDHLCLAIAEELDEIFNGWRDPSTAPKNTPI